MSDDTIRKLVSAPLVRAPDLESLPIAPEQDIRWRALAAIAVFRLLIAVLLTGVFLSSDSPRFFGDLFPQAFIVTVLMWFVAGVIGAYACVSRSITVDSQTEMLLLIDIVAIAILSLASGGASSGVAGLLIIFMAGGAFILTSLTALFYAALATLGVLGVQAYLNVIGAAELVQYPAAGLLSAVMFASVLAIGPLARRLAASEALARQQTADIANLAELNRYVVQHLREAIIVVDGDDNIRLLNDAAASHLGVGRAVAAGPLRVQSVALAELVDRWRSGGTIAAPGTQTSLPGEDGSRLQVHIAQFGDAEKTSAPLLIFLEDISVLAERIQQGKLASLGRLSASIAHEIRNPLGAVSHAAQLLSEQSDLGQAAKLTDIIARNTGRISSIIEDIMQMSRRDTGRPQRLKLGEWLIDFCNDYLATSDADAGTVVMDGEEAIMEVIFDPDHLRQVLTNLIDNARLHAAASPQSPVRLQWARVAGSRRPYLDVIDNGPGIPEEYREQVFEPFFTNHDQGTGLGLFLCQELCELNRATISYRDGTHDGSVLRIVFADPSRWTGIS
ncbi:MAG: ATP-binding protein [Pseudomonadota bacterium]